MNDRPNLQDDGWELESAVQRQNDNPGTFHIPDLQERSNAQAGNRVKLLFLIAGEDDSGPYIQSERMWVTVVQKKDLRYIGRLASEPVTSSVLKPGDLVEFGPEHIASILIQSQ